MAKIVINGIELSLTEKDILDVLVSKEKPISAYQISRHILKTWHYTTQVLRGLVDRGLVIRNRKGQYHVQEEIKEILSTGT